MDSRQMVREVTKGLDKAKAALVDLKNPGLAAMIGGVLEELQQQTREMATLAAKQNILAEAIQKAELEKATPAEPVVETPPTAQVGESVALSRPVHQQAPEPGPEDSQIVLGRKRRQHGDS